MKYRRKSVSVEAVQFRPQISVSHFTSGMKTENTFSDFPKWLMDLMENGRLTVKPPENESHATWSIDLAGHDGVVVLKNEDWIIRDAEGWISVTAAKDFDKLYERYQDALMMNERTAA